jgi:hypothetical protein
MTVNELVHRLNNDLTIARGCLALLVTEEGGSRPPPNR